MKKGNAYLINNNGGEDLLENLGTHTKISVTSCAIDSLIMTKAIEIFRCLNKGSCEKRRDEREWKKLRISSWDKVREFKCFLVNRVDWPTIPHERTHDQCHVAWSIWTVHPTKLVKELEHLLSHILADGTSTGSLTAHDTCHSLFSHT